MLLVQSITASGPILFMLLGEKQAGQIDGIVADVPTTFYMRDAQLLVLDEPTSSLDMRSEALVQQSLTELHGQTTLIIVAHRISTLGICDKLMVLRHGSLEAFAPPSEVATSSEFYREVLALSAGDSDQRDG